MEIFLSYRPALLPSMKGFSPLPLIYLLSFLLLGLIFEERNSSLHPFLREKALSSPGSWIQKQRECLERCLGGPKNPLFGVTLSYLLGINRYLTPQVRQDHKILGLQHLFTPSGFHLSSLLLLFFPLTFFSKKGKLIRQILILTVCLAVFFLPEYWSLKRMALFRLLLLGGRRFFPWASPFLIFLLTFFLDFIGGSFRASPLSFAYSFLFFGIILSLRNRSRILLLPGLLGGYLITAFFTGEKLTVAGFLLNALLSSLFEGVYPFLLIGALFRSCFFLQFPLTPYLGLLSLSAQGARLSGSYESGLLLLVPVFLFSLRLNFRIRPGLFGAILSFSLLLHPESLAPLAQRSDPTAFLMTKKFFPLPPKEAYRGGEITEKGLLWKFQDRKCRLNLHREERAWPKCRVKGRKVKKRNQIKK